MILFGYEWKRYRKYILGWAVAVALCIFGMTPLYYSMMEGASSGTLYQTIGDSDFFRSVGLSSQYLTSPLGIYGLSHQLFSDCLRRVWPALWLIHPHQRVQ